MKKWKLFGAVVLSLTLCIASVALLLECMKPMEDKFYDLSLGFESEGEGMPDDWVYDQKNWTVFTLEGETVTELTADGSGGFSGRHSALYRLPGADGRHRQASSAHAGGRVSGRGKTAVYQTGYAHPKQIFRVHL